MSAFLTPKPVLMATRLTTLMKSLRTVLVFTTVMSERTIATEQEREKNNPFFFYLFFEKKKERKIKKKKNYLNWKIIFFDFIYFFL